MTKVFLSKLALLKTFLLMVKILQRDQNPCVVSGATTKKFGRGTQFQRFNLF